MFDIKPTFAFSSPRDVIVMVLSMSIIALIVITLRAIYKRKKSSIIKWLLGMIDFGASAPSEDLMGKRRVSNIIAKVTEIVTKIAEIKIRTTLFEQMLYTEQRLILLHGIMTRQYALILEEKVRKNIDATSHEDYMFFNSMVSLALNNSKQTIREIFQHTHFDNQSDDNFRQNASEKADIIIEEIIQFIWSMYPESKMNVNFFELDTAMRREHNRIREMLIGIFTEALRISKLKRREIENLKKELDDYVQGNDF